jgi:type IV secretory pathway VirB10-like protein
MKGFKQNRRRANEAGESNARPAFLSKPAQRNYTKIGAAILMVIVLHFVSQFVFFRDEKPAPQLEAVTSPSVEIKADDVPAVEIETESEAKTADVAEAPNDNDAEAPDAAQPGVQPEPRNAPSRIVRKKESRESRAERLRRAERILTGI